MGKYLGVPLTGKTPKREYFQYVIDQVQSKFTNWKGQHLAFASRVTLAKSVIEAHPIYLVMTMKVPKACLDQIHKFQRNFIWGDNDNGRKHHVVSWDKITKAKENGGLSLCKLDIMNNDCLLNMGWKLQQEEGDLWREVLGGKYGRGANKRFPSSKNYGSNFWRVLVRNLETLDQHCKWHIGDGKLARAWSVNWIKQGFNIKELNLIIPS